MVFQNNITSIQEILIAALHIQREIAAIVEMPIDHTLYITALLSLNNATTILQNAKDINDIIDDRLTRSIAIQFIKKSLVKVKHTVTILETNPDQSADYMHFDRSIQISLQIMELTRDALLFAKQILQQEMTQSDIQITYLSMSDN